MASNISSKRRNRKSTRPIMTHRITFTNSRGQIIRTAYAINIAQAWVIRKQRCPKGCRGKIEVLHA